MDGIKSLRDQPSPMHLALPGYPAYFDVSKATVTREQLSTEVAPNESLYLMRYRARWVGAASAATFVSA
jgi:hypothetical protein